MSGTTRVLLIGANGSEIAALAAIVTDLFSGHCDLLAMQLDTSSVDPTLAWGTEGPRVVELTAMTAEHVGDIGQEQPLPEDGDSWKAIAAAAGRYDVNLIAAVNKRQSWFSRLLSGSAASDLVANADWPVLLVATEFRGDRQQIGPAPSPHRQRPMTPCVKKEITNRDHQRPAPRPPHGSPE